MIPSNLQYISGNIFKDVGEGMHILHIANCVNTTTFGYSTTLIEKYPKETCYGSELKPKLGTVLICDHIAHCYAQYEPSNAAADGLFDCHDNRVGWFKHCLDELGALKAIVIPAGIGLQRVHSHGWSDYNDAITKFAIENPKVSIYIIRDNLTF